MKKTLIFTLLTVFLCTLCGFAAPVGDAVCRNVPIETDKVLINGYSIPSVTLSNGYTYLFADDLKNYGFNVSQTFYDGCYIGRLPETSITEVSRDGHIDAYKTDISVYNNDSHKEMNAFETGDGKLLVMGDELAFYGSFKWDRYTNKISINIGGTQKNGEKSPQFLPPSLKFEDAIGLYDENEIEKGVFVYEDGSASEMTLEDTLSIFNRHKGFSMDRSICPVLTTGNGYVNIYAKNGDKFTIYLYGNVVHSRFGDGNYVWYMPYVGNARNALYTELNEKYLKYKSAAKPALEPPADVDGDVLTLPKNWADGEIKEAAALNILPYEFTKNYVASITREDFCTLASFLLAGIEAPGTDSRSVEGADVLFGLREKILGNGEVKQNFPKEYDENGNEIKKEDAIGFSDMEYLPYGIYNLAALGIVNGRDDGTFDPSGSITRQEAAKILEKIAALYISTDNANANTFADKAEIAEWARIGADWCMYAGVMNGVGENTFLPNGLYTREQAIATMVRLFKVISK